MRIKIWIFLLALSFITLRVSAQQTPITITVNGQTELSATLVDNSSTAALIDLLNESPLTVEMRDYGNMEKVGPIGTTLPRNDEQITTEPGDIILYQGNALVIYYAANSWNFTRLGKIDSLSQDELKAVLGAFDVTVTLRLADVTTDVAEIATENDFQIYPNPVLDILNVSGQFEILTLMDIQGRSILKTNDNSIDVSQVKPGIYFLKIEAADKVVAIKKVLKKDS
ncbi:cyclophilin-like fold protein [uncultured Draconibacterium sp.]|uniref:cyclophilin-like fold protein n=1 Tax=uncultured Draconibacterium sp. TaxID=1573823 RepID=UPI0025D1FFC0|nr:cyclophilin-like fold protein [uncultured Draconibacterium sp.]